MSALQPVVLAASAMPVEVIAGFVFVLLIVVAIIAGIIISERKRREAWQELGEQTGFAYIRDDKEFHKRHRFDLFSAGQSRCAPNVLTSEADGTAVTLADYRYSIRSGNNSMTRSMTLCILENEALSLPHTLIKPETHLSGLAAKAVALLGIGEEQDIDFEDDPEFSDAFTLQCNDEEAARNAFGPQVRQYFTDNREIFKERIVETNGTAILVLPVNPSQVTAINVAGAAGARASVGGAGVRIPPKDAMSLMEIAFTLKSLWL